VITVIEYRYHSSWWYWYSSQRHRWVLYQYNQDEWYLHSITVITYVSYFTVSVSPRWVIPVLYHSYHLCLWLLYQYHQDEWYLYSITGITDVSDCTVSVSPRWVIPLLYHRYHLSLTVLYQYHQDEWYLYSITVITYVSITHLGDTDTVVRDIGDNCDRVQVSLILVILMQYSQRHRWYKMSDTCTLSQLSHMSLTTVSVSPRWVIPVLYHSYHLCLWLLYQYHDTVVRDICDNCDRVQVSLILVILIQYSQRHKW
jgi:hypothetical protein